MQDEEKTVQNYGVDYRRVFREILKRKKLFYKTLPVAFVIGCIYTLSIPRFYITEVKLAPEMENSGAGGALSSIASSFGFDLSEMQTTDAITPLLKYGVDKVLDACERYFRKTGRRVSYEYAMVRDVNDTPRHAAMLIDKLQGTGSHVNLIPLNHVDERSLMPSTRETVKWFESELKSHGINVTVRRRLGGDIDASCGQLRRKASPSAKARQE